MHMADHTTLPETDASTRVDELPPYDVVLLDDDHHTYEYVIRMMQAIFGHSVERAFKMAERVDVDGRVVCLTTHKEHAELKRDQILAFGRYVMMSSSRGSMSAVIEPTWRGDDPGEGDDAGER